MLSTACAPLMVMVTGPSAVLKVALFPVPGQATSEVPSPLVRVQKLLVPQVPLPVWNPLAFELSQV